MHLRNSPVSNNMDCCWSSIVNVPRFEQFDGNTTLESCSTTRISWRHLMTRRRATTHRQLGSSLWRTCQTGASRAGARWTRRRRWAGRRGRASPQASPSRVVAPRYTWWRHCRRRAAIGTSRDSSACDWSRTNTTVWTSFDRVLAAAATHCACAVTSRRRRTKCDAHVG